MVDSDIEQKDDQQNIVLDGVNSFEDKSQEVNNK